MAGPPYWRVAPRAWDTLVLGGRRWPGIATVTVKGGQDIDVKKGKGVHGAQLTYNGYAPKEISITLRIWTPDHWDALQIAMADIEPSATKKKLLPLDITHPVTKLRKVKAIAIKDIDGPNEGSPRGCYELKITAIEFFPPKAATKNTPLSAAAATAQKLQFDLLPLVREDEDNSRGQALADREAKYAKNISPLATEGGLSDGDRVGPLY